MKKFDAIVFDLDGTLAESKSPIKSDMADLLSALLKKYKVAVISGAALPQFKKQFYSHLNQGEELKNLYIMPTSGAGLCTVYPEEDCFYSYEFSKEDKDKIISALHKAIDEIGIGNPEKVFGERIEDRKQQITFSALGQEAPLDIKKAWDPDHKKRKMLTIALEKLLPDFSVHLGGSTSVDITKKGFDKASGLRMMMERLGIEESRVLYVGDELTPLGNDSAVLVLKNINTKAVKDPEETREVIKQLLEEASE